MSIRFNQFSCLSNIRSSITHALVLAVLNENIPDTDQYLGNTLFLTILSRPVFRLLSLRKRVLLREVR